MWKDHWIIQGSKRVSKEKKLDLWIVPIDLDILVAIKLEEHPETEIPRHEG